MAIVKALEAMELKQVNKTELRSAVIYTDSTITLDSIRSARNHNSLIEEIRKRTVNLHKQKWKIEFKWVKAHAGNIGNELADRLAKEATKNRNVTYSKIPISAIKKDIREESVRKWQRQWEETEKGSITKEYFPNVESRLAVK